MTKYIIQKEIEAKNIKEALDKEKEGEIVFIDTKREDIQENKVGFC